MAADYIGGTRKYYTACSTYNKANSCIIIILILFIYDAEIIYTVRDLCHGRALYDLCVESVYTSTYDRPQDVWIPVRETTVLNLTPRNL